MKNAKVYTVKYFRSRAFVGNDNERVHEGTLAELTEYYSYTLKIGNSYNKKIKTNPTTIASLVTNVNKSYDEKNARNYTSEYITVIS